MTTDRRRVNGPPGGTSPPVFAFAPSVTSALPQKRTRDPKEVRKICEYCKKIYFIFVAYSYNAKERAEYILGTVLRTGLTPSASGSAYFELEPSTTPKHTLFTSQTSALKLTCTVHGPHPLPRSAPFSSQLLLSTRIKFAPFATRQRRGYIPDVSERDLAAHLETALRGVMIGERWPKSGIDVVVTVLEGEEDYSSDGLGQGFNSRSSGCSMMSILSGCITVASAAISDAGIDCVDLVTGGVAAIVRQPTIPPQLVLDPSPSDAEEIIAACVVGYLQSRDEVTELWTKGNIAFAHGKVSYGFESLVNCAVETASAVRMVLIEAIREATESKIKANLIVPTEKPKAS